MKTTNELVWNSVLGRFEEKVWNHETLCWDRVKAELVWNPETGRADTTRAILESREQTRRYMEKRRARLANPELVEAELEEDRYIAACIARDVL